MKISKLFHWLYAFLMLLPIAFLVPNIFYYAFNDNATNSHIEETTINYKYETNEINSFNDLVEGNIYLFERDYQAGNICTTTYLATIDNNEIKDIFTCDIANSNICVAYNDSYIFYYDLQYENTIDITISNNDFLFVYIPSDYFSLYVNNISKCPTEYIPIESVETITSDYDIVDSIENNLRKTWDLSLFSWTHNNIIIRPFSYLCALFGMSNDSIIAYYLDYWVCISVIYLVFDLVMYVPLLAHKWIDKAKVE